MPNLIEVQKSSYDLFLNSGDQPDPADGEGIADDLSGLVDNASSLMAATSDLIQTTKGIGVFLIIMGVYVLGSSLPELLGSTT